MVTQAQPQEEIQEKLLSVVMEKIPSHFGFSPKTNIQILTPMNRGGLGRHSLNVILQSKLNPDPRFKITKFGTTFAVGDKVIQGINNYSPLDLVNLRTCR